MFNFAISQNHRTHWIDAAKGYGIILVILGHITSGAFTDWIYSFHMPLFFFLSGFVFDGSNDFITFIKKKCKSILIPYFFFGFLIVIFQGLFYINPGENIMVDIISKFKDLLIQIRCWDLWYLACIFWLEILFYFLIKVFKKLWLVGLISMIIGCFGIYYYTNIRVGLFWNIDATWIALPFFYLGYLSKTIYGPRFFDMSGKKVRTVTLMLLTLSLSITTSLLSINISGSRLDIYAGSLGFAPLSFLAALYGILFLILFSSPAKFPFVEYIGRNSLLYYLVHMDILIPIVTKLLSNFAKNQGQNLVYIILEFVILMLTLTLLSELFRNTKLKIFLGKF